MVACRNYYFDVIEWTTIIHVGMPLDSMKMSQPSFVTVDWEHPDTVGAELHYKITAIKNKPELQEQMYLSFAENKYLGRFSKK